MLICNANSITKSFGARTLFSDATFAIHSGERIALVGANGSGKTTLLNIIAKRESLDEGTLMLAKGMKIGYLEQETIGTLAEDKVLASVLEAKQEVKIMQHRLAQLEAELASKEHGQGFAGHKKDKYEQDFAGHEVLLAEYGKLADAFENAGGWQLESDALTVLTGLGFKSWDAERKVSELSGGWQMQIGRAHV